jgi:Prokaryotic N-terminal methylation motif
MSQPSSARSGRRRRTRGARRQSAGYTAIEVLMAMSVLAVGVIGIFSMEKVTISSNVHAKNLAIATHIAQGWLGTLETEAMRWDTSAGVLGTRTTWLGSGPTEPDWFRPVFSGGAGYGPEFDELGNPVGQNGRFCVDLRLSPLNGATAEAEGVGMRRVEVRVYWLRDTAVPLASVTAPQFPCQLLPIKVNLENESRLFHFVYLSGAVRQVVP